MAITVVAGPAGGGKGRVAADLAEPEDVIIDSGLLRAALFPGLVDVILGDGTEDVLRFLQWVRWAAIRHAGDVRASGVVTTSDPRSIDRILSLTGGNRAENLRIVDPGRPAVLSRLAHSQPGRDSACTEAVDRWYGRL